MWEYVNRQLGALRIPAGVEPTVLTFRLSRDLFPTYSVTINAGNSAIYTSRNMCMCDVESFCWFSVTEDVSIIIC